MNNKPIGVFDSGIGGLTVVKSIIETLPDENIIYFGDTANVPYGTKTEKEIKELVKADAAFLNSFDLKALVIACNTADAVGRSTVENLYDLPVLGVVKPAARKAVSTTRNNRIGVIATPAAVESKAYVKTIGELDSTVKVFQKACPKLVPLVEAGKFTRDSYETIEVLREYLEPLVKDDIDTLVLGCTHYPLLSELIHDIIPDIALISSSTACAEHLKDVLENLDLLADSGRCTREYYVSKDPQSVKEKAQIFMPLDDVKLKP